ncbi:CopD family protein [Rhodococcus sp. NPDC058521]|uniref:CopD family protein n=1 Tax=Rhodococcus sp. NPDC058521 TaxID=3346536 RepID=UPI0036698DE9
MRVGAVSRWWLLLAVPTALLGVGIAWVLADSVGPALVRVLTLSLGSVVLGLGVLSWMSRDDRRPVMSAATLWRGAAGLGGLWALSEAVLFTMTAADVENVEVSRMSGVQFTEFLTDATPGRVGAAAVVCTVAVTAMSAYGFRYGRDLPVVPLIALSAVALVLRPVTGHMSQQVLGSALDAAHALAAATWMGVLAAMALVLNSRGAWATWLPRYSALAWRCVWVLSITGVIDTAVKLGSVVAFYETGYGRIVLAKTLALATLLGLGWWWRRTWVKDAAAHRVSADASLTRAVIEVVAMGVPFGLAAALATTA